VLLPPPLVIVLGASLSFGTSWAPYVDPPQLWPGAAMPIALGLATAPPPGIAQSDVLAAMDLSTRAWMLPACSGARLRIAGARTLVGDGANDGQNDVIVHTADWPTELEPGALAHTVIYLQGGRIVETDVHVNALEHSFSIGARSGAWDLRSVLTHEFGHVLGIGHSLVPAATMDAGLPPGIAARSLEADDVTAVCTLYPADAGASVVACDRGGPACPASTRCVGHQCEASDEPGTLGARCSDGTGFRHRCDGVGDDAECVPTTTGEVCGRACGGDAGGDCGAGQACDETQFAGDSQCVPTSVTPLLPDAGPPDAGDAGASDAADATPGPGSSGGGCSCELTGKASRGDGSRGAATPLATLFSLLSFGWLRRARRRAPRRGGSRCDRATRRAPAS
jgi:hypothetical protein